VIMEPVVFIVIISILGPIIGSALGVIKKPSLMYMCNMLCFAAGVMLGISFLDLIPESIHISSIGICVTGIIMGSLVMFVVDRILPHIHPEMCSQEQGCNLQRTSIYLILGIFLHNFPEGMAIAIGSVTDTKISLVIALAIAIHNIPEGICTSAPYYHTTGKRLKAFLVSSSTAVPILAGYLLARYMFGSITPGVLGFIIGATAGLMMYITVDEIIPNSCAGTDHTTIFSLLSGIIFVILLGLI
jgi:zinc transporter, ZIP family